MGKTTKVSNGIAVTYLQIPLRGHLCRTCTKPSAQ